MTGHQAPGHAWRSEGGRRTQLRNPRIFCPRREQLRVGPRWIPQGRGAPTLFLPLSGSGSHRRHRRTPPATVAAVPVPRSGAVRVRGRWARGAALPTRGRRRYAVALITREPAPRPVDRGAARWWAVSRRVALSASRPSAGRRASAERLLRHRQGCTPRLRLPCAELLRGAVALGARAARCSAIPRPG